jgi:hypothetical protein
MRAGAAPRLRVIIDAIPVVRRWPRYGAKYQLMRFDTWSRITALR